MRTMGNKRLSQVNAEPTSTPSALCPSALRGVWGRGKCSPPKGSGGPALPFIRPPPVRLPAAWMEWTYPGISGFLPRLPHREAIKCADGKWGVLERFPFSVVSGASGTWSAKSEGVTCRDTGPRPSLPA